jgi:rhodanese-related sulfurtransferase
MKISKFVHRWLLVSLFIWDVVGCSALSGEPTSATTVVKDERASLDETLSIDLSHETVQALHVRDKIVIVDVRQPGEYAAGHIPGARLIPLGELPDRLDEIPQDEHVVVVCRSGNRSGQAQRILAEEGFDYVHNMLGGMNAWQQAGYDVDKGP